MDDELCSGRLPADEQEATQRQAGATTKKMGKASFATTKLVACKRRATSI